MSTNIEDMIARHRELESIVTNPLTDTTTRRRATEERINLALLIQKDPQNAAEKQNARIADDKAHTAKVDEVLAALAEADNELARAQVGSNERANLMTRVIGLRIELQNLQTITGGV